MVCLRNISVDTLDKGDTEDDDDDNNNNNNNNNNNVSTHISQYARNEALTEQKLVSSVATRKSVCASGR